MKARILELSQRDTPALRLWERWIDVLAQTHIDEAILLGLALALLVAVAWGVVCALSQAQVVGVAVLPAAFLARHGKGKK